MLKKLKQKYLKHKLKRAQKREQKQRQRELSKNLPSAYDDALISWVAPEAVYHQRGLPWKISMVLLILAIVTWGIIYDSWTFSLAILTFAVVYSLIALKRPKELAIKISNVGIKVGNRQYPYSRIKAFWIICEPPYVQTLNLCLTGEALSEVTIQLNGQNPAPIREFLLTKVPELGGQSEKISDIFIRLLKI